jgi:hypothetical protein
MAQIFVYKCNSMGHMLTFRKLLSDAQAKNHICPICPNCANKGILYVTTTSDEEKNR